MCQFNSMVDHFYSLIFFYFYQLRPGLQIFPLSINKVLISFYFLPESILSVSVNDRTC